MRGPNSKTRWMGPEQLRLRLTSSLHAHVHPHTVTHPFTLACVRVHTHTHTHFLFFSFYSLLFPTFLLLLSKDPVFKKTPGIETQSGRRGSPHSSHSKPF